MSFDGRPGPHRMTTIDFGPSTNEVARLVRGVRDEQLGDRTPCPAYPVAGLLDHLGALAFAFRRAATKEPVPGGADPGGDGSRLEDGWRDRIVADLDALATAWRGPGGPEGVENPRPPLVAGEGGA